MKKQNHQSGIYLVTGASSGIGFTLCQNLLERKCQVVGVARRHIEIDHVNFQQINGDLTQPDFIEQLYQAVIAKKSSINAIVLSHGKGRFGSLEQFSIAQINDLMAVNFISVAILLRRFLPILKQQNQGKIIAIGSEAGLKGTTQGGVYCASKFALRGLMQSIRAESAHNGIAVSLINPGMVKTPFFSELNFSPGENKGEFLTAEDVVECICSIINMPDSAVIEELNMAPRVKVVKKKK